MNPELISKEHLTHTHTVLWSSKKYSYMPIYVSFYISVNSTQKSDVI